MSAAAKAMSHATADVLFGPVPDTTGGIGELGGLLRRIITALDAVDNVGERISAVGRQVAGPFVPPPAPNLAWDDCPCPEWPVYDFTVPAA